MKNREFDTDVRNISKIWSGWNVVERVGAGGFGRVYKVVRDKNGIKEVVAVKIISVEPDISDDIYAETAVVNTDSIKNKCSIKKDKCLGEIKSMVELRGNPNIVEIYDYEDVEKTDSIGWDIYIRMAYLTSLDKYLKGKSLSVDTVFRIGSDICSALESCEKKRIIHRDIKISNIFVADNGTFKLGDFGIARTFEYNCHRKNTMIGTPGYMAPEVIEGKVYDNRVDIYSLGRMLGVLLGDNPDYSQEIGFTPSKEVPEDLRRIIEKATSINPDDRFKNASEMKKAIKAVYMRFEEADTRKENNKESTRETKQKNKRKKPIKIKAVFIAIAVMIVALTVGGAVLYFSSPIYKAYNSFDNKDYEAVAHIYDESIKNNFIYKAVFTKRMNTCSDEIVKAYLNGEVDYDTAIKALETLDYMGIVNMNDIKELETYKSDKALLQSAEENFKSGNYSGALEKYSQISKDSPYYDEAITGIQLAFDAYVEEISENIYNYAELEYYVYAFDCINKAYETMPEGVDSAKLDVIKEDVAEKHFQYLSAIVNSYAESDSYVSAFDKIENAASYDDSQAIQNLKAETEVLYEEYLSGIVEDCLETGDFEKATEEVNRALEVLPHSEALKNLATEISGLSETLLLSVSKVYDYSNYSAYTDGSFISMSGKEYTNGFTLSGSIEGAYAVFNLSKNYTQLKFVFGHKDFTDMNDGMLRIYGDDVLIKEVSATASALPQEISVDVENIRVLKFELEVEWAATYGFGKVTVE